MKNNTNVQNGGIGFIGLLTIVFITLKLLGVINWGWLWVLSPLWFTVIFYLAIVVFLAILVAVKK